MKYVVLIWFLICFDTNRLGGLSCCNSVHFRQFKRQLWAYFHFSGLLFSFTSPFGWRERKIFSFFLTICVFGCRFHIGQLDLGECMNLSAKCINCYHLTANRWFEIYSNTLGHLMILGGGRGRDLHTTRVQFQINQNYGTAWCVPWELTSRRNESWMRLKKLKKAGNRPKTMSEGGDEIIRRAICVRFIHLVYVLILMTCRWNELGLCQ